MPKTLDHKVVYYFYADNCPHCSLILPKIADKLSRNNVTMVIKKPTLEETRRVPSVPALFIPENTLDNDKPLLLVGSGIPTWIDQLLGEN